MFFYWQPFSVPLPQCIFDFLLPPSPSTDFCDIDGRTYINESVSLKWAKYCNTCSGAVNVRRELARIKICGKQDGVDSARTGRRCGADRAQTGRRRGADGARMRRGRDADEMDTLRRCWWARTWWCGEWSGGVCAARWAPRLARL